MHRRQIFTVFRKELRDSLRDRRTLFSMIAFPALIMPACMFGFALLSARMVQHAQAEVPAIMILQPEALPPTLREAFEQDARLHLVPAAADYTQQISEKKIRAALDVPNDLGAALEGSKSTTIKLYTYSGEMKSSLAADEIERVLNRAREASVQKHLEERQIPVAMIRPFEIERANVASPAKVGGSLFGGVLPYLLIFLSFMGAMYPAIDLTAGEKERGTMETILCSPVGRLELVLGKFLTVLTISLSTVAVSLVSMGLSAFALFAVLVPAGHAVFGGSRMPMFDPVGVIAVLFMILPLAVLFAAGLFSLSLFARNHKEAQSYVSPFIVLIVLPAMAAMLPGVELNAKLAWVPVLNVSLVSKELVSGTFHFGMIVLIFVSSCVYAALALGLAVRLFKRESVLFRG